MDPWIPFFKEKKKKRTINQTFLQFSSSYVPFHSSLGRKPIRTNGDLDVFPRWPPSPSSIRLPPPYPSVQIEKHLKNRESIDIIAESLDSTCFFLLPSCSILVRKLEFTYFFSSFSNARNTETRDTARETERE